MACAAVGAQLVPFSTSMKYEVKPQHSAIVTEPPFEVGHPRVDLIPVRELQLLAIDNRQVVKLPCTDAYRVPTVS